jgi:hypothetical protein
MRMRGRGAGTAVRMAEHDGGCADDDSGGHPQRHCGDEAGERGCDEDASRGRAAPGGEGGAVERRARLRRRSIAHAPTVLYVSAHDGAPFVRS